MQRIDELRADYIHEYLPYELAHTSVEEAVFAHEETRQSVGKDYTETVAMGKALIDRMNLPNDGSRLLHPLEECLEELKESRQTFDEVWEDRDERLHNWKHGEDYGDNVKQVNKCLSVQNSLGGID
jgi:maltooligosyltrehalose synthase